jgi:hypothetical protein
MYEQYYYALKARKINRIYFLGTVPQVAAMFDDLNTNLRFVDLNSEYSVEDEGMGIFIFG